MSLPPEMRSQVLDVPTEDVSDWYKGSRRTFVDHHKEWKKSLLALLPMTSAWIFKSM